MQNAIQIVFPSTKHRWCLWHILKKLPEKFGSHVDKGSIFEGIHRLVYDSQSNEEFDIGWQSMIETYALHENEWLVGLYENRRRWVPCFLKTSFWAGMSTTQRSESMNEFFDGYVHSKTSLKQFVEQYERALKNKVEKEFQADFRSFSQMVPCATQFEMEQQYQSVYTIAKFREVQAEFTGIMYCAVVSTIEGCAHTTYQIRDTIVCEGYRMKKTYLVTYERVNCEIICSCHLFEFRGILCRHAITVLVRDDITHIPDKYILRRWRRDIRRSHTRIAVSYDGLVSTPAQLRYAEMSTGFAQLANLAADDEIRSRAIIDWIKRECEDLTITTKSSMGSNSYAPKNMPVEEQCTNMSKSKSVTMLDPKSTRRKGAPKKLRRKSPLETASKKAKSSSKSCSSKRPGTGNNSMFGGRVNVQPYHAQQFPMPTTMPYLPNSMVTPLSLSQYSIGAPLSIAQHLPSASFMPPSSANVFYNSQGPYTPFHYPSVSDEGGGEGL